MFVLYSRLIWAFTDYTDFQWRADFVYKSYVYKIYTQNLLLW